jgi:hypothetical protein
MTPLEQYQIQLGKDGIAIVDPAESADCECRLKAIGRALQDAGALPVTRHSFVLPNGGRWTVPILSGLLQDLVRAGDQVLIVTDSGKGIIGTALVCPNVVEGITLSSSSGT